jgi:hypothetical protein
MQAPLRLGIAEQLATAQHSDLYHEEEGVGLVMHCLVIVTLRRYITEYNTSSRVLVEGILSSTIVLVMVLEGLDVSIGLPCWCLCTVLLSSPLVASPGPCRCDLGVTMLHLMFTCFIIIYRV